MTEHPVRSYVPRTKEEMDILWTMVLLPDEIWEGYRNDLRRHGFMVADSVLAAFPDVLAELRALREVAHVADRLFDDDAPLAYGEPFRVILRDLRRALVATHKGKQGPS